VGRERLRDVGVRAERGAFREVGVAALRGQHQDPDAGEIGIGTHRLADVETALAGIMTSSSTRSGRSFRIAAKRLVAVARHADRMAFALHQELERDQDVRLVVGDQHFLGHVFSSPRSRRRHGGQARGR
jgi:hypothetical protein